MPRTNYCPVDATHEIITILQEVVTDLPVVNAAYKLAEVRASDNNLDACNAKDHGRGCVP